MQHQRRILSVTSLASILVATSGLTLASCQGSPVDPLGLEDFDEHEPPSTEEPDERQRLARSGLHLLDPSSGPSAAPANADELAAAIDIPAMFVSGATLQGADVSASVFDQWGVIRPRHGGSFAVLSTGVIDTVPEPGTDMATPGADGDAVRLQIDLEIPEGFRRLSFDYNFVSAESPDYVGTEYNDTFTATLVDPDGMEYEIALASVNSSFFFDVSSERAGGTHFDIFTADPAGVDTDFGAGLPDAGITDFQSVDVELPSTGTWSLVLDIHDEGDGLFDSAVILDNLRIKAMEQLSLNPLPPADLEQFDEPQLVANDGTLVEDPLLLLQAGQRVRGVAADGATRVLLRTQVPSAGTVEYSLFGATSPADGGVGELNGPAGDSVTVDTIETAPGVFYTFAAYTAPADFDRGNDGELDSRTIELRAQFVPDNPALSGFGDIQELVIQRPPVVLVHGLWGQPTSWRLPLLDDARLSVYRASYDSTQHLDTQAAAIPAAVLAARLDQQTDAIAGTQVDLVAHGIGGLLARQHLDARDYYSPENFVQGDVHKLITLNTPHLGSDFATATMAMLSVQGVRLPGIQNLLRIRSIPVLTDGGAVDDVRVGQPLFADLQESPVPSHAIVGSGGSLIPYTQVPGSQLNNPAWSSTDGNLLYSLIEQYHPDLAGLPSGDPLRRAFIFGVDSQVFADDHDMFADVVSQRGGIDASATTTFDSFFNGDNDYDFDGIHYPAPRSSSYSDRIVELLNEPVDGLAFGSFPAPTDLLQMAPAQPPAPAAPGESASFALMANGLTILSPLDGAEITPGDLLAVQVAPDPGIELTLLGLATQSSSVLIENPTFPLSLNLPIPADSSGSLELIAFGISSTGDFLFSSSVGLGATPDATLQYVHIVDRRPYLLGIGNSLAIDVLGLYDDGIERDITSSVTGTEYLTSNPAVFTVTGDGVLVATGLGRATLIARNGNYQDSVTVDVRPGLTAGFEVTDQWIGGYCALLVVTNNTASPTTDWEVTIDLQDTTLGVTWNGVFSGDAGVITVGPEHDWQLAIPGGRTKRYTGFCTVTNPGGEIPRVLSTSASY